GRGGARGIPAPGCWPPVPHPRGQEETQNLDKNSLLERYGFILLLIRGDLPPGALDLFSRRGGPEIHEGTMCAGRCGSRVTACSLPCRGLIRSARVQSPGED